MASALLHMNCAQLNNDSIIRMDGDFSSSRFGDIGVLKRDHEVDERNQVKKRRKQSKPIRIASTESLSEPEGRLGDWNSREGRGSEVETGSYKSEPATPLNLSHNKDLSLTEEDSSWYRIPDNASCLYSFPPLRPTQSVYQNNVILPNQNSSSALVLPNFKRIFVGAGSDGQIASPHRIFNPEAFCDLCNKEFCNKYFLKTHKANKHGIYTENPMPGTVESMPALSNNLSFFPNNLSGLSNSQINLKRMFPSNVIGSAPKSSTSSMRAFCNICQREFCNKYFVRRHKAKIHGIVENTEEGSQESNKPPSVKQDDLNGPGPSNSQKEDTLQEDDKPMKVKREQDVDSETADSPQNTVEAQNGFNYLLSSWQNDESKESSKSPESTQSRKQTGSSSVFCDGCCKEFYSKNVLLVHKQKCQGAQPESEDKSKIENSALKTNQPMPLNLILRESKPIGDADGSFSCSTCSMTFPEQYLLKLHFSIVHSNENKSPEFLLQVYNSPYQPVLPENSNTASSEAPYTNSVESFQPKQQPQPPENSLDNSKLFNIDVQKLHSMIMRLNQNPHLDNFVCDICNKEFGRSSNLENHIIKEHTALLEEIGNGFYEEGLNLQTASSKFDCSKCSSSYPTLMRLDQHLSEKHPKISGLRNGDETQDLSMSQGTGGERASLNTPTSSFCEICKKALCNKYFMKTHMQRMHGISIENGAHIGGVVCDICNKELCSKYFLRVHKQNSHGIVEEALLPQVGSDVKGQVPNSDVSLRPTESELTHRYFSHFTEVCTICSRRFRSVKWLKTHLLNDHGDEGKDKWRELQLQNGSKFEDKAIEARKNDGFISYKSPEAKSSEPSTSQQGGDPLLSALTQNATSKLYQCSYCSFSTSILTLLYVHEKTHFANSIESQDLRCPICMSPRETQESLEHHMSTEHALRSYPKDEPNLTGHNAFYERMEGEDKDTSANEDNNFTDVGGFPRVSGEVLLKCQKCSYTIHRLDSYVEHMRREHCMDDSTGGGGSSFQIVRDALLQMANASLVPASFAVPSTVGHFTMQPFVVEDKGSGSTFASSLVFLPVRERLNKPVTASFRLTPT